MKYLNLFFYIFIWNISNGNMALRPQIDTAKYIIVNQKFKDLKIKSEKWYSEEKKEQWYTREYDTLGRITANFNQIFCGEQYFYTIQNDTLTKIEYQTRNKELININKIENYIYSKSGKVKTYISTYKNRTRHFDCLKFSEHTMVIIEVDQLYYDSLQRIVKIDHFSKSIANQELQLNRDLSMETLIHISTDTFKYDLGQITAVRVPLESSLSETILSQIIYDGRNRVIKESTVWNFNNNSRKDTIEKEFTYEGNKVICLIKRPDLLLTDLTRLNRNEIKTDYYNDAGLITQITNLRVRLNLEDNILIKYEFY